MKKHALSSTLAALMAVLTPNIYSASNSNDYTSAPPFVATNVTKPNVVIALDISGSMKATAYRDGTDSWSSGSKIHEDFNPARSYFGYYTNTTNYRYDNTNGRNFFVADATGDWSGNFLNWLTMRRMDVVRKVLVGGKVRDRSGENLGGTTYYVVEGQNEPEDRTFRKRYSSSSSVSPYADDTVFLISNGKVSLNNATSTKSVALGANAEIGQVTLNRNTSADGDLNSTSNWFTVNYTNTYTTPRVAVTGVTYNGSQPVHARIRNVTSTSFQVRLEEWQTGYDVNHTTEDVTYVVAESGTNSVTVDGTAYQISAGRVTANPSDSAHNDPLTGVSQSLSGFSTIPVVFAGITSQNDDRPVIARVHSITTSNFTVGMQNEEAFWEPIPSTNQHPASETIDWVAFEPFSGTTDAGDIAEVGKTPDSVNDGWYGLTFTNTFDESPIIALASQTGDGYNTVQTRHRNLTTTGVEVKMEEEDTYDSEVTHTEEVAGYLAAGAISGYNIRIGELNEPTGLMQDNSAAMNFGVAVYNYSHTRNPTSIYTGNKVHGGTFQPCYPNVNLAVDLQTNQDICLETQIRKNGDIEDSITVIEDHPLIWGTTPIAETLYDIWGYFKQEDYSATRNGHTQWYDNGTESVAWARNSYEVNNTWDPYRDEDGNLLECQTSFVLHFNDGAPYDDFDNHPDHDSHPTITTDGQGGSGEDEALDELALMLRQQDCRTDIPGHQEIISYYVYAALGEDEAFNSSTRRMREAAANGGFIDANGDNIPTPQHDPEGVAINTYVQNGPCTENNEWDGDEDCNPDNFYFANDGEQLVAELNAAFQDIVTRAATGGASSVIAASRSGEGNVVNAIFRPSATVGDDEVKWIGDVHALMIDSAGFIRLDSNGNKFLEDSDNYLDMCTDNVQGIVRVRSSSTLANRPDAASFSSCSEADFPLDLFDIEYLWSGASWLNSLSDSEATTQRTYTATSRGRYIFTGIDSNGDGLIQSAENEDLAFLPATFTDDVAGLINDDPGIARDIVNWVRGDDVAGYRSRDLDGTTWRLGDVIYSTPTIVGRPAENIDLLYGSTSYLQFFQRYKDRRQMVYAGGNDGLIHAFNGGYYDAETREFKRAHGSGAAGSSTNYDLGAEVWAYAPYNTLAHLEYLARTNYGSDASDHLYFADLKPRVFDAKIFTPDTDHPGGWGTVLVVGMRLGGGETTVDADTGAATDTRTLRSSYSIFDVTNPDVAPTLLLEFSHPDLGFTTSLPAVATAGTNNDGDGDWYLLIGSGADTDQAGFNFVRSTQQGRIFALDLKAVASGSSTVLETNFGTNGIATIPDANSFISDIVTADFGLDEFTTDAAYFGTVSGTFGDTGGKLYRIKMQDNSSAAQDAVSSWAPTEFHDAGRPVTAPPSLALDRQLNRWIYFGTGRYYTTSDNTTSNNDFYFGLKEPRSTSGSNSYATVDSSRIVDISSVEVAVGSGQLSPIPTLSPALPANATVSNLENRMKEFNNASEYLSGWVRDYSIASERNFGGATLLGGTLTYTTFAPTLSANACSIEGDAYLYAVNALTGTAGSAAIIDPDTVGAIGDGSTTHIYRVNIGSSPATTPSLHRGEGYATDGSTTAIIQTANGNIISIDQENEDKVRDGEASWRQLR